MYTCTVKEAERRLDDLVAEAEKTVVKITRRNKPAAALMSWDVYQSLLDTLEISSDAEAVAHFQEGVADIEAGRLVTFEEVKRKFEAEQ